MFNPLRNSNINYERGWFFITVQVAHNKSVFGAVVGEKCELNELGQAVRNAWLSHPEHTPGAISNALFGVVNTLLNRRNPCGWARFAQEEVWRHF